MTDGVASFALPAGCTAQFGGFRGPVDGPPTLNSANAGGNIPVRFTLTENRGLDERGVAIFSQEISCATHQPMPNATFDPVLGRLSHHRERYDLVWRTEAAWEGTCRQLIVRIADVTDPVAWFQFH